MIMFRCFSHARTHTNITNRSVSKALGFFVLTTDGKKKKKTKKIKQVLNGGQAICL